MLFPRCCQYDALAEKVEKMDNSFRSRVVILSEAKDLVFFDNYDSLVAALPQNNKLEDFRRGLSIANPAFSATLSIAEGPGI